MSAYGMQAWGPYAVNVADSRGCHIRFDIGNVVGSVAALRPEEKTGGGWNRAARRGIMRIISSRTHFTYPAAGRGGYRRGTDRCVWKEEFPHAPVVIGGR